MGLTDVTGESIYKTEVFICNQDTVRSKRFSVTEPIYPDSVHVSWNGLVVSFHAYTITGKTIAFNLDFPLTIEDEIIIDYTIEG